MLISPVDYSNLIHSLLMETHGVRISLQCAREAPQRGANDVTPTIGLTYVGTSGTFTLLNDKTIQRHGSHRLTYGN